MPASLEIERKKSGKAFAYFLGGRRVNDKATLDRIAKLALPPAWKDVRIARGDRANLQATGIDAKGRKQYRYHENFRQRRDREKFAHIAEFARRLPVIRKHVRRHLQQRGFVRERVLAAIVDILQRTNMRVGNDVYARTNGSFGITTIRNTHARVKGEQVQFYYRAKSGKMRNVQFSDKTLSRIVKRCQELPGAELFCFEDENGGIHDVTSADVNRYIAEVSGGPFTAKDFRTWCGTIHAIGVLQKEERAHELSEREWRKRHLHIVRTTAEHLGNTPAICEKYYIHPRVFEADRGLHDFCKSVTKTPGLSDTECLALYLITKSSAKRARARRA